MKNVVKLILSIPKSLIFNFRYLPLEQAIKTPFFIYNGVKIDIKGKIELREEAIKRFAIRIGGGGSPHIISNSYSYIKIGQHAKIIFEGNAGISEGSSIRVDNDGILTIGKGFSCNKNCNISCSDQIIFGNDNLLGWNIFIRDTDGHKVYYGNRLKASSKPIVFGEHVWICSFVDILKGVNIPNGCIIAWRACVTKSVEQENVLIGGFPAKIIQRDIDWEH